MSSCASRPGTHLTPRHWGEAGQLPPAELARLLGTFASRVMTPRGFTAVTGLELMTVLHPPTRACEPDANGADGTVVGLGAPTHERRLSRHWLASRPLRWPES